MIQVEMTIDIRDYEPKLFGIATRRQFILLGIGAAYAIPLAQFLYTDFSSQCMAAVFLMTPVFLLGWVSVYGMKLEQFLGQMVCSLVLTPKKRVYEKEQTEDFLAEEDGSSRKKKKIIRSPEFPAHR